MHLSMMKIMKEAEGGISVQRSASGKEWVLLLEFATWIMLSDDELDALKYAVDGAVFERDMGLDGAS